MQSLTFYWKSKQIGGAQLLMARIAEFMQQNHQYEIFVIDYKNGFVSNYLRNNKIPFHFIEFQEGLKKIKLPENTCVITPDNTFYTLKNIIEPGNNTDFIFWNIHPHGILTYSLFSRIYRKIPLNLGSKLIKYLEPFNRRKIVNFIDDLIAINRYVFMDNKTYNYCKSYFPFKSKPIFLPLPINISMNLEKQKSNNKNKFIHIGWLSRLDAGKVYALKYLIEDIYLFNKVTKTKCKLFIVGSGEKEKIVRKWCENKNIPYSLMGSIETTKLDNVLVEKIDIMFAMGTSALESAKLKIPTAMVSADTYKPNWIEGYPYIWLYENKNFSLGLSEKDRNNFKTFKTILNLYLTHKNNIAEKCYNYVLNNHSIQDVCNKLKVILEEGENTNKILLNDISRISKIKYNLLLK